METLTVRRLDPQAMPRREVVAVLDAIHPGRVASGPVDQPHEPTETRELWHAVVLEPWAGDPVHLLVAGAPGCGSGTPDEVLGHAVLELPTHDNLHLGMLELHVVMEHRRHGVGRALLDAAVGMLRGEGRRTLIAEARAGSAMEALMASAGGELATADVRREQPIADLDLAAVGALRRAAERAAAGYRLEGWVGDTPAGRRGHLAHAIQSLNDAPLEDLDYEDEVWDADRVVRRDRFVAAARLRLHVILALAPDGAPAGYTEVAVSADGTHGWQWGTGVDPAHRGHRLGMLMKASMIERLRAVEPLLHVVTTQNAAVNDHMIGINEALGYVPVDRMAEWQLRL